MELKKGIFYGVSIGPGDPELLTLKAVRVLGACAVIATPQTKSGETLALNIAKQAVSMENKTIVPLFFSMDRDKAVQSAAHAKAAAVIASYLAAGQDVALLNLGDVSIYSTHCYLMELLEKAGYKTVMVPGVPSFCAVAARLSISLTQMNSPLHIVPAGGGTLAENLALPGTKVLMKSGQRMAAVCTTLQEKGLLANAMLVENCGLPGERVVTQLTDAMTDIGYFATIVVKDATAENGGV